VSRYDTFLLDAVCKGAMTPEQASKLREFAPAGGYGIDWAVILQLLVEFGPVIVQLLPVLLELCDGCAKEPEVWRSRIRVFLSGIQKAVDEAKSPVVRPT